jgi:hypothetical protein
MHEAGSILKATDNCLDAPMREGIDGAATEAVAAFSLRLITKKKMKKRKREKSSRQPRGGPFISARKRCVKGSDCASGRIPHGKMIAVDFSDWLPWSAKR